MNIDKDRAKDLLNNWRIWAADCPQDPAQVPYYRKSPMFKAVLPSGCTPPYDSDSALMVEEVMRELFRKGYRAERAALITCYGENKSVRIAAPEFGISKSTMHRRLQIAEKVFAEQWDCLVN